MKVLISAIHLKPPSKKTSATELQQPILEARWPYPGDPGEHMDLRELGGSVEEQELSPGFSPKHQKAGGRERGKDRKEGKRTSQRFPCSPKVNPTMGLQRV